jgi:tol-pal system protein YbgF
MSSENAERRQLATLEKGIESDRFAVDRTAPRIVEREEISPEGGTLPATPESVPRVSSLAPGATRDIGEASPLPEDDPADTTPRTVIRIWGSGKGGQNVQVSEAVTNYPPKEGAALPASQTSNPEARRSYDAALALVNGHAYDRAAGALGTFLLQWPNDANAANAMYWQAECYFAMSEYARATELLDVALERFPQGGRAPDCLLKLALCQEKLGNAVQAKGYYERLRKDFPKSEAARRIPQDAPTSANPGSH